jgi:hypothetical protein
MFSGAMNRLYRPTPTMKNTTAFSITDTTSRNATLTSVVSCSPRTNATPEVQMLVTATAAPNRNNASATRITASTATRTT